MRRQSAEAHEGEAVGIDVEIKTFCTLSNGIEIDNPKFFRAEERNLAKAQRKLASLKRGSDEYKKQRKVVARIRERITNTRKDFAHQLSHYFAITYALLIFEKLNIRGMMKNHCLAKSISDAAWGQVTNYTAYKVEKTGRKVLRVNPAGTSDTTACCKVKVVITLADRVIHCPKCQREVDRDWNASQNIKSRGLARVGLRAVEAASL